MELSNFVLKETVGTHLQDRIYIAEIDVMTGALWWKKTKKYEIRRKLGGDWYFADDGYYILNHWQDQVRAMARAWEAKTGQPA